MKSGGNSRWRSKEELTELVPHIRELATRVSTVHVIFNNKGDQGIRRGPISLVELRDS